MKIKDISAIINGSTPSTGNDSYWNGDIPWITPKDLSSLRMRLISCGERNITKEGYNSCSTTLVPKNTVLLTSRAPIGYVAIAANPLCTNQGFKSIICDESIINHFYMYYWLLTRTRFLQNVAGGSTFKELSKQQLESLEIVVPDLRTQQHIVDIVRRAS